MHLHYASKAVDHIVNNDYCASVPASSPTFTSDKICGALNILIVLLGYIAAFTLSTASTSI